jgi:Holliday junction DNA helicase RuvA
VYDFFDGTIATVEPARTVVECGGIGYILQISQYTAAKLPKPGGRVRLLAHLVVVDGEPRLYGFADAGERELFRMLTSVSGVGPSTALQVLSGLPPADLVRALAGGDEGTLRRVKGVGAKTASRLVVELKDSAQRLNLDSGAVPAPVADAQQALLALGFTRLEVQRLLDSAVRQLGDASSEELIKAALAASRSR